MGPIFLRAVAFWVVVVGLVGSGCSDSPEVLYKELVDDDPQVRADAAKRLGDVRAPEAVESLVAILDDPDEAVRVQAVRALGKIGDPGAVPALAELGDDPLSTVRLAVIQSLGEIGDPRGVPTLKKLLHDGGETIRLAATRALGDMEGEETMSALVDVALRDESEMVRQHVIQVIGIRDVHHAIPKVEKALEVEADIVRSNAARVLGEVGDASSVPVLLRALDDPHYKVRSLAAHALYKLAPEDPRVRERISERLEDESNQMTRVDLAWNLVRLGQTSALEIIRELLVRGRPEDVRAEAAMALGDVGEDSDMARLARAINDRSGLVRREAYRAFQKLKGA